MTPLFADTFFYLALLNRQDAHHQRALSLAASLQAPSVTTEYVLTELLDGLALQDRREIAGEWVRRLRSDPDVKVVPGSPELWQEGFELYSNRSDKAWSLTDCISFVVMSKEHISEA